MQIMPLEGILAPLGDISLGDKKNPHNTLYKNNIPSQIKWDPIWAVVFGNKKKEKLKHVNYEPEGYSKLTYVF